MADDLETPAVPVSAGPALNITFTATLTEPYLRRHVRYLLRRQSLTGILLSLCLLGISILCFMAGGQAVFPGLMCLALALMFLFWLGFPTDRYVRSLPAYVYGPREFVISGSELTVNSATTSSRMTWQTFARGLLRAARNGGAERDDE